jgi:hypothetical protein
MRQSQRISLIIGTVPTIRRPGLGGLRGRSILRRSDLFPRKAGGCRDSRFLWTRLFLLHRRSNSLGRSEYRCPRTERCCYAARQTRKIWWLWSEWRPAQEKGRGFAGARSLAVLERSLPRWFCSFIRNRRVGVDGFRLGLAWVSFPATSARIDQCRRLASAAVQEAPLANASGLLGGDAGTNARGVPGHPLTTSVGFRYNDIRV